MRPRILITVLILAILIIWDDEDTVSVGPTLLPIGTPTSTPVTTPSPLPTGTVLATGTPTPTIEPTLLPTAYPEPTVTLIPTPRATPEVSTIDDKTVTWACERKGIGAVRFQGTVDRNWIAYLELLSELPDWCVESLIDPLTEMGR